MSPFTRLYNTIDQVIVTFAEMAAAVAPNLKASFLKESMRVSDAIKDSKTLEHAEIVESAFGTSENVQELVGAILNGIIESIDVQRMCGDAVFKDITEYMRHQYYTTLPSFKMINETVFSATAGTAVHADGSQTDGTDIGSLGPFRRVIPSEDDDDELLRRKGAPDEYMGEMQIFSQKYFEDDETNSMQSKYYDPNVPQEPDEPSNEPIDVDGIDMDYGAEAATPFDWDYSPETVRKDDDQPLPDEAPRENKWIYRGDDQVPNSIGGPGQPEVENKWIVQGEKVTGESVKIEITAKSAYDAQILAESAGIYVHDIKKKINEVNPAINPYPTQSYKKPLVYKSRQDPHKTQRDASQEWVVKGHDAFGRSARRNVYADDDTGAKRVARELKGIEYDKDDPEAIMPYSATDSAQSATQSGLLRRPYKKAFVRDIQVPMGPATVPGTAKTTSREDESVKYEVDGPEHSVETYCTACHVKKEQVREGASCICTMNDWVTVEQTKKKYRVKADSLVSNEWEEFDVIAYDKEGAYNLVVESGYLVNISDVSGDEPEQINEIDFSHGTDNAYGAYMAGDKEEKTGSGRQCENCDYEFPKYKGRYPNYCPLCGFAVEGDGDNHKHWDGAHCPNCKENAIIAEGTGSVCKNCGLQEQKAIYSEKGAPQQQGSGMIEQKARLTGPSESMGDLVDNMLDVTSKEQNSGK